MLNAWTNRGQSGALGTAQDTRTLSLDVLTAVGFRKSNTFHSFDEPSANAEKARNYRQSLKTVMDNSILMMVAPPKLLSSPFVPKVWAHIGQATQELKQYMMEMLNEEKSLLDQCKPGTGSIMTSLVRASENHQKTTSEGPKALTVNEILGNIFLINFAGHDTTANTLAYAMLLLAANPGVQNWVGEELEALLRDKSSGVLDYESLFPRLKRCQAVLVYTHSIGHCSLSANCSFSLRRSDFSRISWRYRNLLLRNYKNSR